MPKVMIGAPVRNRAWVLPRFIEAIKKQDIEYETCFIVNDCEDNTEELLKEAGFRVIRHDLEDKTDKSVRGYYSFHNLAKLRNILLEEFLKSDCDYLFSVDTDIIIPENSIQALIDNQLDVVAMLIKNHPTLTAHNAMIDGSHVDFEEEGIFSCHLTGAVYLIHRRVIEAGVRYGYHIKGEDGHFSDEAMAKGFQLHVDTRLRPIHAYDKDNDIVATIKRGETK